MQSATLQSRATVRRSTLPTPLTNLIGRDEDIATLAELLCSQRLITLAGTGGVGKTRLAIAVAQLVEASYAAGAWFVNLATVTAPNLIATAIATTLEISLDADLHTSLLGYLESRELLLVLDNCEHLIDAMAQFTTQMLQCAPRLTILATSREVLRIEGERVWRVPALATPPRDAADPLRYAPVRLFVERAATSAPQHHYSPHDLHLIASLCTRLDGIPLAIELAAARTTMLSVAHIAQRVDDVFSLLVSHNRGALSRHQTLRATIAWSYELLTPAEQLLLSRLAVCTGSWTLAAAEALGGVTPLDPTTILALLTSLYNKSLIVVEGDANEKRYRCLETIRQFGLEQLAFMSVLDECRQRHMAYYVQFVQCAAAQVMGPEQASWLQRIEAEMPNIWSAYTWGRECADLDAMLTLVTNLGEYWYRRGKYADGRARLEELLAREGIADHPLYANLLFVHGNLTRSQDAYHISCRSLQQARESYAAHGDTLGQARALSALGWNALFKDDVAMAESVLDEALALLEKSPRGMVYYEALGRYGWVLLDRHEYERARILFETAIAGCRALGDVSLLADRLVFLGHMLRFMGDIEQAEHCYLESATLFSALENRLAIAMNLGNLANVALLRGDFVTACARNCEALTLLIQHQGRPSHMYGSLITAGNILVLAGHMSAAARIYGAAAIYAEQHGVLLGIIGQQEYDHFLSRLQAYMDAPSFAAAWSAGQHEAFEAVLQRCLAIGHTSIPISVSGIAPHLNSMVDHLTAREQEVLQLLAKGLTNRQIADHLMVSAKTVSAHLAAIFKKLEVTTRSAATRYAHEHQLA